MGVREYCLRRPNNLTTYRTIGDGGPVFVFLHGFPDFWESLIPLSKRLNPTGTNVFFDLRGYNGTPPLAAPEAYRILDVARDFSDLASNLGASDMVFVGHDWGGAVAWWLWMMAAPKFRAFVSIAAPHPSALFAGMADDGQWQASAYARTIAARDRHEVFEMDRLAYWCNDETHRTRLVAALERSSSFAMASYYNQNYPRARDMCLEGLPSGPAPFLLVYGAADPYILAGTFERSAQFGGAQVSIAVVSGGHFVHVTETDMVSETINRWLADV
ncbi:alpha/beta hydrolase [Aquibium sp. ELW1220]|uniref:alpha/beta fold hydrolase n=1 Tax=Aquibium sp. ELW1220 TaxID=2976766 RepID=UPI0025B1C98A|nr:alpha/beta hydrolase [Aquibium sp. ELW1220]MDN2578993.1 alpha/beta hydrolase [Aquibium sp. ELW1220]